MTEGKSPVITIDQRRTLLTSIDPRHLIGPRDRAILATLAYTAFRGGAVAKLRLQDFQGDGSQCVLRFHALALRYEEFFAGVLRGVTTP